MKKKTHWMAQTTQLASFGPLSSHLWRYQGFWWWMWWMWCCCCHSSSFFAVVIISFVVVMVVGGVLRMRWRSPAVTCVWCVMSIFGKLCSTVHRVLNPAENKCSVSVVVNCACLATVGLWVRILTGFFSRIRFCKFHVTIRRVTSVFDVFYDVLLQF